MAEDHTALAAARELTDALNGLSARLDAAEQEEKANRAAIEAQEKAITGTRQVIRRLAWAFAITVLAVTAAAGVFGYILARENSSRITADCQITNEGRAEAVSVLDGTVLPDVIPHATPAGKEKLAGLEAAVAARFAPHACG